MKSSIAYQQNIYQISSYFVSPFGMQMDDRSYAAAGKGYRFAFNGMEQDNEVKGDGNSLDFGARIYDSRLGRWLSLDPLMAKYPGMSPYNYTANNPILYIDQDGRDYGVYVNHDTKTIIVKATYHSVKGDDATNAKLGAEHWNNQKDYEYVVGTGDKAVTYKIQFELTVKEHDDATARDAAFVADKSGEGNKFKIEAPNPSTWGTTASENGGGYNSITTESTDASKKRNTPGHEIGHTLGLEHFTDGLMESGSTRTDSDEDKNITTGMVSRVLNNLGIGTLVETATDKQTTGKDPATKASKTEKGTAPTDFNSGKVQKKTP